MTVQKLINQLGWLPPKTQILMSCDGEGNNFSPLYEISTQMFWDGDELYGKGDIEQFKKDGYSVKNIKPVVVLWPE